MTRVIRKTRLKGGSLSGTYLCETEDGPYVRKEVSLRVNREYGFQRWYSQLKRMQRYSVLFPGTFPRLLTYGRDSEMAYFDMEYIPDAVTVHEFLMNGPDRAAIDAMFGQLVAVTDAMYKTQIPSTAAPIELYIYEEIEQKMLACAENARFREISSYPTIVFNGVSVPGLASQLPALVEMARARYQNTAETFSHGNLTLENILYQPKTNTIVLIDPYEENVVDSTLADYSQILQSCNSHYEIYNALTPRLSGNQIDLIAPPNEGLAYFRSRFFELLNARYNRNDLTMIGLLEVSQYARMLPFKMAIDEDKMVFFYGLGSYLFDRLCHEQ